MFLNILFLQCGCINYNAVTVLPPPYDFNWYILIFSFFIQGYKVLQVPYTEYNPKDKLVARVQYIEKKLKELISSAS